jgi:hypothetical protein
MYHLVVREDQIMKIITDCGADMPAEELKALDITEAPLYIQFRRILPTSGGHVPKLTHHCPTFQRAIQPALREFIGD